MYDEMKRAVNRKYWIAAAVAAIGFYAYVKYNAKQEQEEDRSDD